MTKSNETKGISYSDRELGILMKELSIDSGNSSYAKDLIDISKSGKWKPRLILLSYFFINQENPSIDDILNFCLPLSKENGLSGILNLSDENVRAMLLYQKGISRGKWDRNWPGKLERKELLEGAEGKYHISENGRKTALMLYLVFLRAQGIDSEHIMNYILRGIVPEGKKQLFRRMKLTGSDNQPSEYTKALFEIIEASQLLKSGFKGKTVLEGIVLEVRNHLMRKIVDSELLLQEKLTSRDNVILPTEWTYRLQAQNDNRFEFDPVDWMNDITSDSDEDFDFRKFCFVLVAGPGCGKTNWMIQSSAEIWNSQWNNSEIDSKPSNITTDTEVIPIFLELRNIDAVSPLPDGNQILLYGDTNLILWSITETKNPPRKRLILSRLLQAVLASNESVSFIEKALGEFEGRDKQFILFLDGWNELKNTSKPLVSQWIKYLLDEEIPIIISSREEDELLQSFTKHNIQSLNFPTDEDILKFMSLSGMHLSRGHIWNLKQVLGPLTPLNLRALAVFPKLIDLPSNQVTLYRNLITFQGLREAYPSRTLQEIQSKEDLASILSIKTYQIHGEDENIPIGSLIRRTSFSDESKTNEFSIMTFVPRVAYHELIERNAALPYDYAIEKNPLLKAFIDSKLTQDMIRYPEIRQKHLILYLAAEYIFNEYLNSRFKSINGDSRILYYLLEIIRQDKRSLEGDELLKPEEKLMKIILEAESRGDKIRSIEFPKDEKAPSHFHSLFYSFVNYWQKAMELNIPDLANLVIAGFAQVMELSVLESKIEDFIPIIYRIESILDEINMPSLKTSPSPDTILVETLHKWSSGYLKIDDFGHAFSRNLNARLWLLPWIARIVPHTLEHEVLDVVILLPNDSFQASLYRLFLLESPSSEVRLWIKSLLESVKMHKASEMIELLIDILPKLVTELDDDEFENALKILQDKDLTQYSALNLVMSLGSLKTNRRQKELVKQLASDTKSPMRKRFFALASRLGIEGMDLEETFKVMETIDEPKWIGLILPIVTKEYQIEAVRSRALLLPRETINILERYHTKPVELVRISREGVTNVSEDYVDSEFFEIVKEMCEAWWNNYLRTYDDAINILEHSLEKRSSFDDFSTIAFEFYNDFDRLVDWISFATIDVQRKFILKCLDLGLDLTFRVPRTGLWAILQKFLREKNIITRIIKYYQERPSFFLAEFSPEFWIENVSRFSKESIFRNVDLLGFWIQSGELSSIEDAIDLVKHTWEEQIIYDIIEVLLDWIKKQTIEERLQFLNAVFELDIDYGIFHSLLDEFEPIKEKAPDLYSRLYVIAKKGQLHFDSNIEGLRDHYSYRKHYNTDHAYLHLENIDQNHIVRPIFDRILTNPDWQNQFIFPVLRELFRIANDASLMVIAGAMDQEPIFIHELTKIDREKVLRLKEVLTNPYSIMALERSLVGIEDYLSSLEYKKAEEYLEYYIEKGNQDLPLYYLNSRDELRNMVLDRIEEITIEWNSIYSDLYLDFILKKQDEKSMKIAVNIVENVGIPILIRWMNTKKPTSETYVLLNSILNLLSSSEIIMLIIYTLVHLGGRLEIDTSDIWETTQYLGLSGKARIELRSGRWNPNHLMQSLDDNDLA